MNKTENIQNKYTYEYFFDKTVPFDERWNKFQELKEEDIQVNGKIYHKAFDKIAEALIKGDKLLYIYGPDYSGKTVAIYQFCNLIGANYYDEKQLYDSLKSGGICRTCCSELNDSLQLEKTIEGVSDNGLLIDGQQYLKNLNFRLVIEGYTNLIDYIESIKYMPGDINSIANMLEKFEPIYVGLDYQIEKHLLLDNEKWIKFVRLFKETLYSINTQSKFGDISFFYEWDIRRYLNKCKDKFTDEEIVIIVSYERCVQNVRYLPYIIEKMDNTELKNDTLYQAFRKMACELVLRMNEENNLSASNVNSKRK